MCDDYCGLYANNVVLQFFFFFFTFSLPKECYSWEFECDGRCIAATRWCSGDIDCEDLSDESNCRGKVHLNCEHVLFTIIPGHDVLDSLRKWQTDFTE